MLCKSLGGSFSIPKRRKPLRARVGATLNFKFMFKSSTPTFWDFHFNTRRPLLSTVIENTCGATCMCDTNHQALWAFTCTHHGVCNDVDSVANVVNFKVFKRLVFPPSTDLSKSLVNFVLKTAVSPYLIYFSDDWPSQICATLQAAQGEDSWWSWENPHTQTSLTLSLTLEEAKEVV